MPPDTDKKILDGEAEAIGFEVKICPKMLSQLLEQKGMYYTTCKSHFPSIVLPSFMNVCNCVK